MAFWAALISPLTGLANTFIKGRQQKAERKDARHLKEIEGIQASEASEYAADAARAESLQGSWKDEYITLIISIPVVLCFLGPDYAQMATDGFTALSATPEWFQWLVLAVFSVGAGVPLVGKTVKTISSIKG
jgi:hypothetical protein